jgi:hypothetical protein
MAKKERRPGDPYEVGFGKPPQRTRFKKGRSGNPNGRPREKPDLYSELAKVLRDNVAITLEGQSVKVTVQQALLFRLRDQALKGEIWAEKLLQKVIRALPESVSGYDDIERQFSTFGAAAMFDFFAGGPIREEPDAAPDATEAPNAE